MSDSLTKNYNSVNSGIYTTYSEYVASGATAKTQTNINETLDKSSKLLAMLHSGGTLRHFWTPNGRKSGNGRETLWRSVADGEYLPKHWIHANPHKHVYFGINTSSVSITDGDRKKKYLIDKDDAYIQSYTRGKSNYIDAVNCVFADFDGKDFTQPSSESIESEFNALLEKPENAVAGKKALWNQAVGAAKAAVYKTDMHKYNSLAFDKVRSLPIQPSVWWFSGGGFQCAWLLDQTITIDDIETLNFAKSLQKRWTDFVDSDPAAKDLARVLRLPGSFNVKSVYPEPQFVTFVEYNTDLRYTTNQIIELLPDDTETQKKQKRTYTAIPKHVEIANEDLSDIELDDSNLSTFAIRVLSEYNRLHSVKTVLEAFGYADAGNDRLTRPGSDTSKGVAILENNRSWHFSSSDLLYTEYGSKSRTPFDVVTAYQFGGDYEDAAIEIGRELGILTKDAMDDFLKRHRDLVLTADWSKIVPVERQSKKGYRTGATDRLLYDNVLDYAKKAGRIKGLNVSLRGITEATNPDGVKVALASHDTARNFLMRVNGVLVNYDAPQKTYADGDYIEQSGDGKSTTIDLIDYVVVARSYTIIDHNGIDHVVRSNNDDTTGEITFSVGGLKAEDVFARGTSRFQKRSAWRSTIGDDENLVCDALDAMLPGLGFDGLLVVIDLFENPGATRADIAKRRGLKPSTVGTVIRKLIKWDVIDYEQDSVLSKQEYTIADDVFIQFSERIAETRTFKVGAQRLERRLEQMQVQAELDVYSAVMTQDEGAMVVAEKRANRATERRFMALAAIYPHWTDDEINDHIHKPRLTLKPWIDAQDAKKDAEIEMAEINRVVNEFVKYGYKGRDAFKKALMAGYSQTQAQAIKKHCNRRLAGVDVSKLSQVETPFIAVTQTVEAMLAKQKALAQQKVM